MYMGRCSCSFPIYNRTSQFSEDYLNDLEILWLFSIIHLPKIHLSFIRIKKCVLVSTMVKQLIFKGEGDSVMEMF